MSDTGVCEIGSEWGDMDLDERLVALEDMINAHLEELGYDPVTLEGDDLSSDGNLGDYKDGKVRMDNLNVRERDVLGTFNTAFHEAAHSMEDQDRDYDTLSEEEKQHYNDIAPDGVLEFELDEDGEYEQVSHGLNPEHEDIYDQAEYWLEERMREEGCGEHVPPPSPSAPTSGGAYGASSDDAPEIEFDLSDEEEERGEYEADMENATVNGEPVLP